MTITRQYKTPSGHALRVMHFEVGGKGCQVVTAYYRSKEKKPFRVKCS